jgi:hypothetical protein
LVGWWGFNGNAQDGSGNGNHGTVNGATLTTDRFGNQNGAYSFDGINDYIIANATTNMNESSRTISLWINEIIDFGQYEFLCLGNSSSTSWGCIASNGNMVLNHGRGCTNNISQVLPINFSLSSWHHLVYVTTGVGGNTHMYFNGQYIGNGYNASTVGSCASNYLYFGVDIFSIFEFLSGSLDDIGIWNRALTQQEITNLYNSQLPTQTSLCLPTITTNTPSSIGIDSVIVGGNITNDGGSSIVLRGVCYSTTPNPNMGNMRTEDGSGVGSFSTILRNLNPSTTYYVRSYAKNSNGVVVYGDEVSINTMSTPLIGSNYAGGIVFYLDSTGQHGLVCAPFDQPGVSWGCIGTNIFNTSTAIGSGASNTALILSGCAFRPIAASVCADLVLNGYSDWYLPSHDELQLMYNRLRLQGLGGFDKNWYWSSSQFNHNGAYFVYFSVAGYSGYYDKNYSDQGVRAVRTF